MEEIWSFKVLFFCKYCIKVVAFVWFIFLMFWRYMIFQSTLFCKYHITVWAFVMFFFLMFWRNMIFQSTLFCKYRITVGALVRFIFLMFRRNMIFQITLGTTNVFCNFSFLWTFSTWFSDFYWMASFSHNYLHLCFLNILVW